MAADEPTIRLREPEAIAERAPDTENAAALDCTAAREVSWRAAIPPPEPQDGAGAGLETAVAPAEPAGERDMEPETDGPGAGAGASSGMYTLPERQKSSCPRGRMRPSYAYS